MPIQNYKFCFRINFNKIGRTPKIYWIVATNYLQAFTTFCEIPDVQALSMDDIKNLTVITHEKWDKDTL